MNWFTIFLGVGIAGVAGFLLEPDLRERLTGEAPIPKKPKTSVASQAPAPKAEGEVAVSPETPAPTTPDAAPTPEPTASTEPPAPAEVAPPAVDNDPFAPKDFLSAPPVLGEETPATPAPAQPEMAPTPAETPSAPAKETPAESTSGAPMNEEQIVKAMQSSFESGEIKEFASIKPTALKAATPETIEGVTYDIGIAEYEAETLLGMKSLQAKALIQNGKVVKWLSAKSGMEIK